MNKREIKFVSWQDIRTDVQKYNQELAEIIDELSPDHKLKLIKASYHFGDLIVKDGLLQVPTKDGDLTPITDHTVDKKIASFLSYSPIPLTLLLNKASEVFVTENTRVIPLNLIKPGNFFGTFETLNYFFNKPSNPIWNVSAGARSIIMLAKISEAIGFRRLKAAFDIFSGTRLKYLSDHWQIFKEIVNHPNFCQPWSSEVLFFPKEWIENKGDINWFKFQGYFLGEGWAQSQYAIDKFKFSLFWQSFVKAITNRNLKPSPYLADTVKHLLTIATGSAPAFRPADNTELVAPTMGLQKVFIDIYQLKQYLPTIMYPEMLSKENSVYYSLSFPSLLEGSPVNKSSSTHMLDLKDIKLMIDTLLRGLEAENNLIDNVGFEYFHVEEDKFKEIKSSKQILVNDIRILKDIDNYPDRSFCHTSQFWRGCIRISLKNKDRL